MVSERLFMLRVVADDKIPFLKGVLENVARVSYIPGSKISRNDILSADALIIRTRTKCNEQLLEGTGVKYIATATIGYDHIDTEYCMANNIAWSNAPGCNSGSVMQYIASALGHITSSTGKRFADLSLGIVGAGNVGSKVENLARLLGMRVIVNDPPRQRDEGNGAFSDLATLLAGSDIVSMHVPLNMQGPDRTFHLAGEWFFGTVKKGAWFINTSRGEVMQTGALLDSLRKKHLHGAILDVWENEPDIDSELLTLADLATPHIAGYSLDGKANGTARSVRAISRHFSLGMDDWYPENLMSPVNDLINIQPGNDDPDRLARSLFFHSYEIEADSNRLKSTPADFELLRDNYPPRREFHAYKLNFEDPGNPCIDMMRNLGFRV
jgi:erythronate-4-phosphate dehydrogenase